MSAALGARLTDELTYLALCWRLVRRDGIALGFTAHDRAMLVGGLWHMSAPGISPSAVVLSDGAEVDTMDVAGALSSDAITAADLAAGRWDGAALTLFLVDWRAPDAGRHVLATGVLGAVASGIGPDAGFSATLLGPTAALGMAATESCSPECRAELGDDRCRAVLRGRRREAEVTGCDGESVSLSGIAAPDHVEGRLRIVDGPLAGLERRFVAADGDMLRMDEPLALLPGMHALVWEGCDKRFSTCRDRFGNARNFRGEPHVPGGDLLARFGGN